MSENRAFQGDNRRAMMEVQPIEDFTPASLLNPDSSTVVYDKEPFHRYSSSLQLATLDSKAVPRPSSDSVSMPLQAPIVEGMIKPSIFGRDEVMERELKKLAKLKAIEDAENRIKMEKLAAEQQYRMERELKKRQKLEKGRIKKGKSGIIPDQSRVQDAPEAVNASGMDQLCNVVEDLDVPTEGPSRRDSRISLGEDFLIIKRDGHLTYVCRFLLLANRRVQFSPTYLAASGCDRSN